MTKIKRCSRCKEDLPLEDFSKHKSTKDGLDCYCKKCKAKIYRVHYEKNKERTHIKTPKEKYCPECKEILPFNCFSEDKSRKDGLYSWCKKCKAKAICARYEKNRQRVHVEIPTEKSCSKCGEIYPSEQFRKNKSMKDGLEGQCKKCMTEVKRAHCEKNKNRTHVEIPKEKYCYVCKKIMLSENFGKAKSRKDGLNPVCKRCIQKYIRENRQRINEYERNKKATDTNYRLSYILRNRLRIAVKSNQKVGSAVKDLGCTIEEFKQYIEKQFEEDMSWENYGLYTWHLDHIKPLVSFDLTDRQQFLQACHYTNYQPLWAHDNLSKGAKYNDKKE